MFQGYMIDVDYDGETLRVHGTNKPARVALAGEGHEGDVVLRREQIAAVDLKDAGRMTNGNLKVSTVDGRRYQLHFLRKQSDDFRALADALTP